MPTYIGNNRCSRCGGRGGKSCYVCHDQEPDLSENEDIESAKEINNPQNKGLQVASNALMSSHDAKQSAERPSTTNKEN